MTTLVWTQVRILPVAYGLLLDSLMREGTPKPHTSEERRKQLTLGKTRMWGYPQAGLGMLKRARHPHFILMEITKINYTKKGSRGNIYTCRVWYIFETREIVFLDCECWNFANKRLSKIGKVFLTKIEAEPCKHLKYQVDALINQGYEIKKKGSSEGEDICTMKLRRAVLKACKDQCHYGGCEETQGLEIHRQTPGYLGGKYSLVNCVALCNRHHKEVTYQPWHRR